MRKLSTGATRCRRVLTSRPARHRVTKKKRFFNVSFQDSPEVHAVWTSLLLPLLALELCHRRWRGTQGRAWWRAIVLTGQQQLAHQHAAHCSHVPQAKGSLKKQQQRSANYLWNLLTTPFLESPATFSWLGEAQEHLAHCHSRCQVTMDQCIHTLWGSQTVSSATLILV